MLIEARFVLAKVDFKKLKVLVEENPKWQEDDMVRPDMEKLFHSTVDQFLFPYLFHGTEEEAAARGLMNAAVAYGLFRENGTGESVRRRRGGAVSRDGRLRPRPRNCSAAVK